MILSAIVRCFLADVLKLRRTLALALAVLLPAAPPLLFGVYVLQRGSEGYPKGVGPVDWTAQGMLSLWAIFLLSPFVAIETSLLAGIEHNNRGWKHLMALPVSRVAVYAGKFCTAGLLLVIATASLWIYMALSLRVLALLRPEAGFDTPLPIPQTLGLVALTGITSLLLFSVHAYVALRWASFALNIGVALAASLGNAILVGSPLRYVYPWSLPAAAQNLAVPLAFGWKSPSHPSTLALVIAMAISCSALVAGLAVLDLSRRDVG